MECLTLALTEAETQLALLGGEKRFAFLCAIREWVWFVCLRPLFHSLLLLLVSFVDNHSSTGSLSSCILQANKLGEG